MAVVQAILPAAVVGSTLSEFVDTFAIFEAVLVVANVYVAIVEVQRAFACLFPRRIIRTIPYIDWFSTVDGQILRHVVNLGDSELRYGSRQRFQVESAVVLEQQLCYLLAEAFSK